MITQAKKLELIQKHAKKFVAPKTAFAPILEGVHYAQGGTAYATNRYYAFRIRNAHTLSEAVTSHVTTGEKIDGTYPDIGRVFPVNFKTGFILQRTPASNQIQDALQHAKWAWEIAKANDGCKVIQLALEPQKVVIGVRQELVEFKAWFAPYEGSERFIIALNGEYLLNALQLFKDAGTKALHVRLNGKRDAIVLSDDENEIDVLILPYRLPEVGT